jgi:hypothetical protein
MDEGVDDGTGHAASERGRRKTPVRVVNWYKAPMAVMLICPKCESGTELRGTMDSWYLTWCPECERLWRLDLRTLLDDREAARPAEPVPPARRPRSRLRPSP